MINDVRGPRRIHDVGKAMTGEQPGYRAYLLRLWQVRSGGQLEWRASLEDVRSGERHGFATLDLLITYLWQHSRRTDHPDEELPANGA